MKIKKITDFAKIYFKKIVGVILIIGGIAGLFLPFFQGVAMIIVGSVLLLGKKNAQKKLGVLKTHWRNIQNYVQKKLKK